MWKVNAFRNRRSCTIRHRRWQTLAGGATHPPINAQRAFKAMTEITVSHGFGHPFMTQRLITKHAGRLVDMRLAVATVQGLTDDLLGNIGRDRGVRATPTINDVEES
jgi:hypothetical protein